jgi:hypothetical protein
MFIGKLKIVVRPAGLVVLIGKSVGQGFIAFFMVKKMHYSSASSV